MKLKIFIRMIGWPLFFVLLVLWPPMDRLSVRLLILIIFIGPILFRAISKKFLSKFIITEDKVYIHFITGVGWSKNTQWRLDELIEVKLIKGDPWYGKTSMLYIKAGRNAFVFSIIDQQLFEEVAHDIASNDKQLNKKLSNAAPANLIAQE